MVEILRRERRSSGRHTACEFRWMQGRRWHEIQRYMYTINVALGIA